MIHYLKGDATQPRGEGIQVICHVVNNIGVWGAGFTGALDRMSPVPREVFMFGGNKSLGYTSFAGVSETLIVANMCAQSGVGRRQVPIRYDALEKCLETVTAHVQLWQGTLHMPRIGCGLAGGSWDVVEPIIQRTCGEVEVFVYDL